MLLRGHDEHLSTVIARLNRRYGSRSRATPDTAPVNQSPHCEPEGRPKSIGGMASSAT